MLDYDDDVVNAWNFSRIYSFTTVKSNINIFLSLPPQKLDDVGVNTPIPYRKKKMLIDHPEYILLSPWVLRLYWL